MFDNESEREREKRERRVRCLIRSEGGRRKWRYREAKSSAYIWCIFEADYVSVILCDLYFHTTLLHTTHPHTRISDQHGFSPLHYACMYGYPKIVDMFLLRCARTDIVNMGGNSLLHMTAQYGKYDILMKVRKAKSKTLIN